MSANNSANKPSTISERRKYITSKFICTATTYILILTYTMVWGNIMGTVTVLVYFAVANRLASVQGYCTVGPRSKNKITSNSSNKCIVYIKGTVFKSAHYFNE